MFANAAFAVVGRGSTFAARGQIYVTLGQRGRSVATLSCWLGVPNDNSLGIVLRFAVATPALIGIYLTFMALGRVYDTIGQRG